jgi:hypothetical protein
VDRRGIDLGIGLTVEVAVAVVDPLLLLRNDALVDDDESISGTLGKVLLLLLP